MGDFSDNVEGTLTLTLRRKADGDVKKGQVAIDFSKVSYEDESGNDIKAAYDAALLDAMHSLNQQISGDIHDPIQ